MAIKIANQTIISDSRELQNIASTDVDTRNAINNAIALQSNVLTIYDSLGSPVRVFYTANAVIT
tara:strand:- start:1361 stop:1552 length:192 start_codon:yes stop_codon:yes gene_type:complete